jgi:hypothetical protein
MSIMDENEETMSRLDINVMIWHTSNIFTQLRPRVSRVITSIQNNQPGLFVVAWDDCIRNNQPGVIQMLIGTRVGRLDSE